MTKFIFIFFIYYYNLKHFESANLSVHQNKNQTISLSQYQNLRTINLITPKFNHPILFNQFNDAKCYIAALMKKYTIANSRNPLFGVFSIKRPFDGIIKIGIIKNLRNTPYTTLFLDQLILIIKKAGLEKYCSSLRNTEEIKQWAKTETFYTDFIAGLYCLSRYISNYFYPRKSKDISFSKVPEISPEQTLKYVIYFFEIIMNIQNRGYSEHYNNIIERDSQLSVKFYTRFIHLII